MTPPIDIRADHLRIVQDVLHRHLSAGVKVWVFGSRASWATKDSSDLDLALDGETEIPRKTLSALEAAFEESDLPYTVDIVDLKRINEQFRQIVQQQRVPLSENGSSRVTDSHNRGFGVYPDWREMSFTEAFLVNPPTQIERGTSCAFVNMATVNPSFRSVRASEVREFRGGGSRFRDGDTLMARITPCLENGKVTRYCADGALEPAHGSTEFIVVRGRPGITDTEFAFYVTRSSSVRDYAIGQMTGTSGRQRVPTEALAHLTLAVPSPGEQRAIAHILGTLDDKIELNQRMNATLEGMARALFRSWFVDFDPVRAKMEGRDTGLPKDIADLFPDRLVDSELGEIPDGWEVATVGDHIVNFDAKRIPVSGAVRAERRGPYPYHGAAGVLDHVDDYIFDGVFLLLGEDGSVMRENGLAVTQYVWGKFWVNNHAHVLQGTGPVSTEQAYLHFSFEPVAPLVTGAVQPKLSQSRMNRVPFVFAGEGICRAFTRVVQPWFARLRSCAEETKILAALRDALLPRLVSGELRVGNWRAWSMDKMPIQEANQPIPLGEMEVEFEIDGRMVRAHAKAMERLIPSPDLILEVSNVPREPRPLAESSYEPSTPRGRRFPITSEGPSTVQLGNGRQVPIVPTSWLPFQDCAVLHLQESPTVVLDTGNPIARTRFSLLNFTSSVASHRLVLQAQPWSVSIEPVSNLQELEESLRADRGYAITHQGVISHTDQQAYSVQDAKDLLDGLDHFLSFVRGSPCSSTNVIGVDSEGNETWKRWGARHVSPWRTHRSWFDITASNALCEIFPVFWQEFKDHKVHLSRILELYANSNVTVSCDVAIILTQVALECLTYMTVGKRSRRKTGEWIAAALQEAKIETQIPSDFANLEVIRKREKWAHGPHTIVELRNSMIHAESLSGNISIDAYYEAMNLSLWYLELLLLKRFKYTGKYASRLTPVQRAGDTELVPWVQRGGA